MILDIRYWILVVRFKYQGSSIQNQVSKT